MTEQPTDTDEGQPLDHDGLVNYAAGQVDEIFDLEGQRKAINKRLTAIRAELASRGLNKSALAHALQFKKLDADQRDGYDLSYQLIRKALKLPMGQLDIFRDGEPDAEQPDAKANGTGKQGAAAPKADEVAETSKPPRKKRTPAKKKTQAKAATNEGTTSLN